MSVVLFCAAALLSILAATLVVTGRKPAHAPVALAAFFALLSFQFLILGAPFLALVQAVVCLVVALVFLVFAVLLAGQPPGALPEALSPVHQGVTIRGGLAASRALSAGIALAFFGILSFMVSRSRAAGNPVLGEAASSRVVGPDAAPGSLAALTDSLFSTHILAFEFTWALLLTATLGAVCLAGKSISPSAKVKEADSPETEGTGKVPTGGSP